MRLLRRLVLIVPLVAAAAGLTGTPAIAGGVSCGVMWSTGPAPASAAASVCVTAGATVTLDSSRSWSTFEVLGGATLLVGADDTCPSPDITLATTGQAIIATGATVRLRPSCTANGPATPGTTTLQIGQGLHITGVLALDDCDEGSACGGGRAIGGNVQNAGVVAATTAGQWTGSSWDNTGVLEFIGGGALTVPAGSATFHNTSGGIGSDGTSTGPDLQLAAGDTFDQGDGTTSGKPVAVTDGALKVTGAGTGSMTAIGDVSWSGGTHPGQTIHVSCQGTTTLHVTDVAVNQGNIAFDDPYGQACGATPTLAIDGAGASLDNQGLLRATDVAGAITQAGALHNSSLVAAEQHDLTLDAAPTNVSGHSLGHGWAADNATLSWPLDPDTTVTDLTGAVSLSGTGSMPNLALGRIDGGVNLSAGAQLVVPGELDVYGSMLIGTGATLTVPSGSQYEQFGGQSTTTLYAGGTLAPGDGALLMGGALVGAGTVDGDLENDGGLIQPGSPGLDPATLTVTGAFTQGVNGELDIDAAGTGAGTHDEIDAATAALDGTAVVTPGPTFAPQAGGAVPVVVTTGATTGSFAGVGCTEAYECSTVVGANGASVVFGHQHTVTTLSRSTSSVGYGHEGSVRFTVHADGAHAGHPGGTVAVRSAGHTLCTVTLSKGVGSCHPSATALTVGAHHATAAVPTSASYFGSTSAPVSLRVTKAATTTSVRFGAGRFHLRVTPRWAGTPTGSVTVKAGTRTLCTAHLHAVTGGAAGRCAPTGLHKGVATKVSARYVGDAGFLASTGTATVTRH